MNCGEALRFIHAYVDGEFSVEDRAEMDEHLRACETCREEARVQARFKSAVRARLDRPAAPARLRARIEETLDAETGGRSFWQRMRWRLGPAIVASGALATFMFFSDRPSSSPIVEQSILDHVKNLPVEVAGPDPDGVGSWFHGKVDFPVRPPRLGGQAQLLGGRIGHLGPKHAAYLVYSGPGGRKVSVFIFDPSGLPSGSPQRVMVGNRPVYMSAHRGYQVAMFQDHGVGYAVAADLADREMLNLLGASLER
jgi:anti-sigma factor (TIGR02949 family)